MVKIEKFVKENWIWLSVICFVFLILFSHDPRVKKEKLKKEEIFRIVCSNEICIKRNGIVVCKHLMNNRRIAISIKKIHGKAQQIIFMDVDGLCEE